jgi:serpin B
VLAVIEAFDDVNDNSDFQAVELPYVGNRLEMVILLPRQIEAIGQLEKKLSPGFLADVLGRMERSKVQVFLPKFKLAPPGYRLEKTLMRMGMPDAFGPEADFSGMNGDRGPSRLIISEVIHKAWIEVKEEGTEAAAATVVVMLGGAAPAATPPPPVFRADHPFIFLIRDIRSGSLLFLGRLVNPTL